MTTQVPCESCVTCCRDQYIILMAEDEANLSAYQFDEIKVRETVFRILKSNPDGTCVHLGPQGCSIYEQRPEVCRAYDCRKQFLIMSRNERRQFKNSQIWDEARKRLPTLDDDDRAHISDYRARARAPRISR